MSLDKAFKKDTGTRQKGFEFHLLAPWEGALNDRSLIPDVWGGRPLADN